MVITGGQNINNGFKFSQELILNNNNNNNLF